VRRLADRRRTRLAAARGAGRGPLAHLAVDEGHGRGMRPLDLSVVVPCYNEAKNLPELVERLARVFDRRDLAGQVVLVDDGSADDTAAVIRALAAQDARVLGVFHPANRGIAAAW